MKLLILLTLSLSALAQQPFQSLEGAVGYVVVERAGKGGKLHSGGDKGRCRKNCEGGQRTF